MLELMSLTVTINSLDEFIRDFPIVSIVPPVLPAPPRESVKQLIEVIDAHPQLEIPVTHYFSPGVYMREITMPAGMTGVGHVHRHRHMNIALTGRSLVTIDGVTTEIVAPFIFESMPGAQKAFHVIEDLRWITIHANPNGWDESSIVEMEREIFELPQEMIDAGVPVDDYRMTKRTLCPG